MSAGAALEHAIAKAFDHYAKVGRASAKKQHNVAMRSRAPIDFRGTVAPIATLEGLAAGGRSLAIECKETALPSFEMRDDKIDEDERLALDTEQRLGALTYLVVDFTTVREVYAVTWDKVQAFIAHAWRASLSIDWFRAHGELVPESDRDDPKRRSAWLLDARPHFAQATAYLKVAAEKAAAEGRVVELFPCERKPSKVDRFAERPAPGTPEHKEYIKQLAIEGMDNATRRAGKPKPGSQFRRKRGGWMGGR